MAEAVGASVEIAKARLKELRSLGHKVERFLAARAACWKHAGKASATAQAVWMRPGECAPGELGGDGLFACAVRLGDAGFRLWPPVLPQEVTAGLAARWQQCDADAPKDLPAALSVPEDANDPLWIALLRLRPLRELWERELRRATLEGLLNVLPDAWVLDPTPLPPGAVIPRLELAAWRDLAGLQSSGRRFAIAPSGEHDGVVTLDASLPRDGWASAIAAALEAFATGARVLIELSAPAETAGTLLVAFYERKGGRVDCIGTLGLRADGEGRVAPARAMAV
jgi:hypothetical protein